MRDTDKAANAAARFYPYIDQAANGGLAAEQAIELAGAMVYAYAEDGVLCVDVEPNEAHEDDGVFGMAAPDYGVPVRVRVGGARVYQVSTDGTEYSGTIAREG